MSDFNFQSYFQKVFIATLDERFYINSLNRQVILKILFILILLLARERLKNHDFEETRFCRVTPAQFIRYLKSFYKANLDINKPLRL